MTRLALLLALLLVVPALAEAQVGPRAKPNKPTQGSPVAFAWKCPNHQTHQQHEIDIIEVSSGTVVQTLLFEADATAEVNGEVVAQIRVAPTVPGTYVARVRAIGPAGPPALTSLPSEPWVTSSGPWDQDQRP